MPGGVGTEGRPHRVAVGQGCCAAVGLVKFDLLGLGMLSCLHDTFDLIAQHYEQGQGQQGQGQTWDLHSIPQEDPAVYRMLQQADTVGVFQVESRAQMATLPRLRPEKFYDLVVEVALIRPGPIQGGSVHPYLRRRRGDEDATLPHESMHGALGKTLGVPLFQEQMMQIAIDCAGFTPAEADRLRQAMSAKRAPQRIEELRQRLLDGMAARDIPAAVAEEIYEKILAFSSYGFPESHAISFAYLVYASAWLKCYYPAAFTAALLRNQPMGFYSPATLITDARRHGVEVRGVDINASEALATLETVGYPPGQPGIRLGLSSVRDLGSEQAETIAAGRPYTDLDDFARRTRLSVAALQALAIAGAFGCFGLSRRAALWAAGALASTRPGQLPGTTPGLAAPPLPAMTPVEETLADLWATGASGTHPIAHIRRLCRSGAPPRPGHSRPPRQEAMSRAAGWLPTGNGRLPRVAWCSSTSKTKPAWSTSSARPLSGRATGAVPWTRPPFSYTAASKATRAPSTSSRSASSGCASPPSRVGASSAATSAEAPACGPLPRP